MKENRLIEYNINHTENFFAQFGGSPEFSLRARGYFMYSPCGFACKSLSFLYYFTIITILYYRLESGNLFKIIVVSFVTYLIY